MLSIRARICLLPKSEGGFRQPVASGIQPSMSIKGDLVACKILTGRDGELIVPGREYEVRIDLGYGEVYADALVPGFKFSLNLASRVIGHGEII